MNLLIWITEERRFIFWWNINELEEKRIERFSGEDKMLFPDFCLQRRCSI